MVVVTGEARFHPEDMPAFRVAAAEAIRITRQEPGCLAYAYAEDLLEPGLVHTVERWTDQASIDAHLARPHMAALFAVIGGLRCLGVRVVAADAGPERVLIG